MDCSSDSRRGDLRCDRSDLEYNGTSLEKLFVQRKNLVRPSFYRMVTDIVRFYRESRELLDIEDDALTLGQYLRQNRYSEVFIDQQANNMGGETGIFGFFSFISHDIWACICVGPPALDLFFRRGVKQRTQSATACDTSRRIDTRFFFIFGTINLLMVT